eukprot:Awhi_evm1s2807
MYNLEDKENSRRGPLTQSTRDNIIQPLLNKTPVNRLKQVSFQTQISPFRANDKKQWQERTEIVTKQDHKQNLELAK